MEWGSLLYFFVVCLGLGSFTEFFAHPFKGLERFMFWLGSGLALWVILGVMLNLLHIPLLWWIFILIALIPAMKLRKGIPKLKITVSMPQIAASIVIIITILSFALYYKGAFAYPWIEDDDGWEHTKSIALVAYDHTAYHDADLKNVYGNDIIRYTDPYPPGYAIVIGTIVQTNQELFWSVKFFNALFVSLGILFFYLFARTLFSKVRTALFATIMLAMLPSYLSHFIWAHSLALPLFFPALTAVLLAKENPKWMYFAGILSAAIVLTQPTKGLKFMGILGIFFLTELYSKGQWKRIIIVGLTMVVVSMIWWVPMLIKHNGPSQLLIDMGMKGGLGDQRGTATRAYGLADFLLYKDGELIRSNQINNPVGIGIVPFILLILGIILLFTQHKKWREQPWKFFLILLYVYALCGVLSFPLAFFSFRFWSIFAVVSALIIGYLLDVVYANIPYKAISIIAILVVFGLGWKTAAALKIDVNTSQWYPGVLWNSDPDYYGGLQKNELTFYLNLDKAIPKHTKVFPFCYYGPRKLIALDYDFCVWCKDDVDMFNKALNTTPQTLYAFLKQKKYEYVIIDSQCAEFSTVEEANQKIIPFLNASGYQLLLDKEPLRFFKVV